MTNLEENTILFKKWVKEYSYALKIPSVYNDDSDSNNSFYSFMKDFKNWLYNSIHEYLAPNKYNFKYEKVIRIYCKYIKDKILPVCNEKIAYYNKYKGEEKLKLLSKWIDLEDDYYALASFRDLKMMALYLERERNKKVWRYTMHLFENTFYYMQQVVLDYYDPEKKDKIETLRASYFPGAGKTFAGNLMCAFWFGVDEEISILRITYSDDLCSIFIQQIANIIDSYNFRKIFPKFDLGEGEGNSKLYSKYSIALGFKFTFSSAMNFYAITRDGQTTGKRGVVLLIDDITKGVDEAYDERLHKKILDKYDVEWTSRTDSSYQPKVLLGTMWSPRDLLNIVKERTFREAENIVVDNNFKYTELIQNENGNNIGVFISTPILDYDTDESTCPERYSTAKMRKKREDMDPLLWGAVYQQRPQEPDDFIFAEGKLLTYDDISYPADMFKQKPMQCWAFIDPTRKGIDYFAMGIFKRYQIDDKEWSKWYLVDCIFEQKPTKELMYDVASKFLIHKITKLGFEDNIDGSFDTVLKSKLRDLKYNESYIIDGFFSHKTSKETKIMTASSGMKKEIIYPSTKMYSLNNPMGKAMHQFRNWSLKLRRGDHDDFPDMISMFVKYYCEEQVNNTIQLLNYSDLGFR